MQIYTIAPLHLALTEYRSYGPNDTDYFHLNLAFVLCLMIQDHHIHIRALTRDARPLTQRRFAGRGVPGAKAAEATLGDDRDAIGEDVRFLHAVCRQHHAAATIQIQIRRAKIAGGDIQTYISPWH